MREPPEADSLGYEVNKSQIPVLKPPWLGESASISPIVYIVPQHSTLYASTVYRIFSETLW